ncbi:hypothetical protein [Poseidonibacter lekithochrous]|uniref:hypothetical protein n=1 Tax=Poseidonibacter lekithochrous TaxID=1904463 RepID=UPI0008FCA83F|nr:hypothetical protein [Poseidonibacter lekithochrous]QKJ21959.1 hypothetical protein ALEK_0656 [Poseidonibacter lekithochrous]
MKKIVLISLLLFSSFLFAHSQTPSIFGGVSNKLDSISTTQIKVVKIHLQNLNAYSQQYYLEIDGKYIGLTNVLKTKQLVTLEVPVMINKENTLELHKVCTVSIPKSKEDIFKTKICTKAYLYWVNNK